MRAIPEASKMPERARPKTLGFLRMLVAEPVDARYDAIEARNAASPEPAAWFSVGIGMPISAKPRIG
jgi:hypothetical protein